ncbi:unnamed protein product [Effrenium voratum]|uniref:Uncharacterized protein n=1 Tax=Effrenium voratum TaxID=2562239 RepID=A0AA36JA74_9DINO|nr:unnamed protein product [Effrenium voratum]
MAMWVEALFGGVGAICFALMMVPQVVLNTKRRCTEGLSWGLVLPWHIAGVMFVGVTLAHENPSWFAALSMFSQVFFCGICEVQMFFFRRVEKGWRRRTLMSAWYVALTAMSCLACAGCYYFFKASSEEVDFILGELVPSVLIALGFIPEFYEFISSMSIEGYSFGVTFFDVVGSAGNAATYLMRELAIQGDGRLAGPGFPHQDEALVNKLAEAAPFLTIIAMHIVLLMLAAWVVCNQPSSCSVEAEVDNSTDPSEDENLDGSPVMCSI